MRKTSYTAKGIVIIMNEYNMENFENQENISAPNPFEDVKLNRKKKRTGLKITALLLAMGMVSGGSVLAYRGIAGENGSSVSVSEERQDDTSEKSKLTAKPTGIINAETSGNAALSTEEAVEKTLPSVVGIESEFAVQNPSGGYFYGFGENDSSSSVATGTGTGVIITEDGYIVTNAHVIYDSQYGAGLSENISVLVGDGETYDAEVIGYDTDCDLAVLKIKADDLVPAEFGDSDSLKLGESVTAIGNPLGFDLMNTVTSGIVSGLNRQITINNKEMTLLQTDAAINSGNSGGPLINKYGQVIGINSSKMSASYSETSIEGIGFAIPSNEVSKIVDDLMEYGYVTGKPQLGINCQDVTETVSQMYRLPMGVYVISVNEGSAAEKAGLETGDVITAIDGEDVASYSELNSKKNLHKAGDEIELTYVRRGETKTVKITLDENTNNE